jgi:hypothetical protein
MSDSAFGVDHGEINKAGPAVPKFGGKGTFSRLSPQNTANRMGAASAGLKSGMRGGKPAGAPMSKPFQAGSKVGSFMNRNKVGLAAGGAAGVGGAGLYGMNRRNR